MNYATQFLQKWRFRILLAKIMFFNPTRQTLKLNNSKFINKILNILHDGSVADQIDRWRKTRDTKLVKSTYLISSQWKKFWLRALILMN